MADTAAANEDTWDEEGAATTNGDGNTQDFDGGGFATQEDDQMLQDDEGGEIDAANVGMDILGLDDDDEIEAETEDSDTLLMKFCPHDSSMLYPKEHKRTKTLHYACRLCRYSEESRNPLIYRNLIKKEMKNVLHTVPSTVADDPTLPRSQNASCENCGHNEAVFFQPNDSRSDTLALIFVCCNCAHKWVA